MSPDAVRAAEVVAERTGADRHDVAVVLGSGWAPAVEALGAPTAQIAMAELPGFAAPSADGHRGQVLSIPVGGRRVLVLVGRIHAYEGHDPGRVVHRVRTAVRRRGHGGGADQCGRRTAAGLPGRPARADQRPPQSDRPLPAGGRGFRRPGRRLFPAVARAGPRGGPDPGRGGVRRHAGPALRDARRDPDAADPGRRSGRHVDGARDHRRPRRRRRGAGGLPGHQPGRRHDRGAGAP